MSLDLLRRARAWIVSQYDADQQDELNVATVEIGALSLASLIAVERRAEREACAQELYSLGRWCRDHGLAARASHTESAARRLQGVGDEGTTLSNGTESKETTR